MTGFLGLQIALIFILMIANGFFAASEIAIVSARRSRLQQEADAGKKAARQALDLAERPDRFLATVQVGMTLVATITAAFGEASLSKPLADWLETVSWLQWMTPYAESVAFVIVVVLITYFTLILGELVPKRFALQSAERLATFVSPFMVGMSRVARPIVAFL